MENKIFNKDAIITWIIPVYNGERYIDQAIRSILQQPCDDLQVLVVDDGSNDNTYKVVNKIKDNRLKIIRKENGGVASARNYGIDRVFSRYIAFLDADDIICKNAYSDDIHTILEKDEYDLLSFSYFEGDQNLKRGTRRPVKDGEAVCDEMALDPFKHGSSFVYRRNIFEGDHAVRYPEGIKLREDVTFQYLAYKKAKNIRFIDKNWSVYRNNISSTLHKLNLYDSLIRYAIPAWDWCKGKYDEIEHEEYCNIRLLVDAASYVKYSCMAGIKVAEIQKQLNTNFVQDAFKSYEKLWRVAKAVFESFNNNPKKYWTQQRRIGKIRNIFKKILRIDLVRKIYFRRKYKTLIYNIKNYE